MFHPKRLGLSEFFLVLLLRDSSSAPPLHRDAALGRLRFGAVERSDGNSPARMRIASIMAIGELLVVELTWVQFTTSAQTPP